MTSSIDWNMVCKAVDEIFGRFEDESVSEASEAQSDAPALHPRFRAAPAPDSEGNGSVTDNDNDEGFDTFDDFDWD